MWVEHHRCCIIQQLLCRTHNDASSSTNARPHCMAAPYTSAPNMENVIFSERSRECLCLFNYKIKSSQSPLQSELHHRQRAFFKPGLLLRYVSCGGISFKGLSDHCVNGLIAPIELICVSTKDPLIFQQDVVSYEWHQMDV